MAYLCSVLEFYTKMLKPRHLQSPNDQAISNQSIMNRPRNNVSDETLTTVTNLRLFLCSRCINTHTACFFFTYGQNNHLHQRASKCAQRRNLAPWQHLVAVLQFTALFGGLRTFGCFLFTISTKRKVCQFSLCTALVFLLNDALLYHQCAQINQLLYCVSSLNRGFHCIAILHSAAAIVVESVRTEIDDEKLQGSVSTVQQHCRAKVLQRGSGSIDEPMTEDLSIARRRYEGSDCCALHGAD